MNNEVVGNTDAYIKSKMKGQIYIPLSGWQYSDDGTWRDDDTLTVTVLDSEDDIADEDDGLFGIERY